MIAAGKGTRPQGSATRGTGPTRLAPEWGLTWQQPICGLVFLILFTHLAASAGGEPSAVLARYHQLLERQPREGAVFDKVCRIYEEQGGLNAMLQRYEHMAQESPREATPHLILGHVHKRRGDFPTALKSYQQAEKLSPRDAYVYQVTGQLLVTMKRPDQAVNHLKMAVGLEAPLEQRRAALRTLGECYWELGEPEVAVSTWQRMTELEPEDLFTRIELAELFAQRKLHVLAIQEYKKVAESQAQDPYQVCRAWQEIGKLYELQKKPELASEAYLTALKKAAPGEHLYDECQELIQQLYLAQGDQAKLIGFYKDRLAEEPRNTALLGQLARSYQTLGQPQEAITTYQQALGIDPDSQELRWELIRLLDEQRQFDAISEHYRILAEEAPNPSDVYREWGEFYLRMGQPHAAHRTWRKIAEENPRDPAAYAQIADLFAARGQWPEAIMNYEIATELASEKAEYKHRLGELYFRASQQEKAVETWLTITDVKQPTAAQYHLQASVLETFFPSIPDFGVQTRMFEEARRAARKATELAPQEIQYWIPLARLLTYSPSTAEEAAECLGRLIELAPTDYFRTRFQAELISLYQRNNTVEVQIAQLESGEPTLGNLHLLAVMYLAQQDYEAALEKFQAVLAQKPNDVPILCEMARLYQQLGRYDDAIRTYEQLADLDSGTHQGYDAQLLELHTLNGNTDALKEITNRMLARDPDNPTAHRLLAEGYFQAGAYEEAASHYREHIKRTYDADSKVYSLRRLSETYRHLGLQETLTPELEEMLTDEQDPRAQQKLVLMLAEHYAQTGSIDAMTQLLVDRAKHEQHPEMRALYRGSLVYNLHQAGESEKLAQLAPGSFVREAEEAESIYGDLKIGTDDEASGGKFLWVPEDPAGAWEEATQSDAMYSFPPNVGGNYIVLGRFLAPDHQSDSFFFRFDEDTRYIPWHTGEARHWDWRVYAGRGSAAYQRVGTNNVAQLTGFPLVQGMHRFWLRGREDGTRADVFVFLRQ